MRIHIGRPLHKCFTCGRSFRNIDNPYSHTFFHEYGPRPFSFHCAVCGLGFWRAKTMKRHMRRKHRDDELTSGAQATTSTQHTESFENTVSMVNSPVGAAIVTKVESFTSPAATITYSQASGTVTVLDPGDLVRAPDNECPICFDSLNDGETITTPCCNKIFHTACLRTVQTSFGGEFPCPNCGTMLTREWLGRTPAL
ncbi:RING finger domain-containing protein [Endozoicomonas euniceicola]|uniref:RING finger domain-containing protein n=1 Tax=Endozoicomonas euniceicola TaxID=1234143 RepID=UPI00384D611A